MPVWGSIGRVLPWASLLGGVVTACGTASDLDLVATGSGGAPPAVGGTRSGGRSFGGAYPVGTGGECTSTCGLGNCCFPDNARCERGAITCYCTNGIWSPCGTTSTGGAPPMPTGGRASASGGRATGGRATGGTWPTGGRASGGAAAAGGPPTLAQACDALCAVIQSPTLAACQYPLTDCYTMCTGYMEDPFAADPQGYPPMVRCLATLPPSGWECSIDPFDGTMFGAIPAPNGPCELEICVWTCWDATLVDNSAFMRCGC